MKTSRSSSVSRRQFVKNATLAAGGLAFVEPGILSGGAATATAAQLTTADLPRGNAPQPVALPHFPDRVHAFVWRNWTLVPLERLATVLGTTPKEVLRLGQTMGLPAPPRIARNQWRRSYLTIIRRNWHLLPYEQLLTLLNWTPEELAFTLREDDFLFIKLGSHKPACAPLKFAPPDAPAQQRAAAITRVMREEFPTDPLGASGEPLFQFVRELSTPPPRTDRVPTPARPKFSPRYCYSYFALYGDPLLESEADPYPDGFLARLAAAGVDGVWLQAVLYKLARFPWQPSLSARHEERLKNLRRLVLRARQHGIGVWLYLNEPRAMPVKFFTDHPELRGVVEGDHATLCTSHPDVQRYLTEGIASICRAVPELAGFFTITASENLTNCWSHQAGAKCPRCAARPPGEVIAEVNRLIFEGIQKASERGSQSARNSSQPAAARVPSSEHSAIQLFAWDWGWNDAWAGDAIHRLPQGVALMSVSEWSLPIERGGVKSAVGEYSISAIGPGPRATKHWALARQRGLKTIAKIQAGNTWELSAVPYIPAVENVARHAANLREAGVDGLMLGWTLGGYPSPNLEAVTALGADASLSPAAALLRVAERRFGPTLAPLVVTAWREFSAAFREFPYHIGVVYSAPQQLGPANLLWAEPTGYRATMVGFPYDDLDGWRALYPPDVFATQLEKVADGFEIALVKLKLAATSKPVRAADFRALQAEMGVAEAAAVHFRSVANQTRFVLARRALQAAQDTTSAVPQLAALEKVLKDELSLARRLHQLQRDDSRLGFEASNQYYYVPQDLAEKALNCRDLLDRWLPQQRSLWKTRTSPAR